MNDEQLIEFVRKYSVLYNLSDAKYMDTNFKNEIWNKIGEELNTDGHSCKSRWNNIRDNYRKSLKKIVRRSGQNAKQIKLYKYATQLSFLNKYFNEKEIRNTKSENYEECIQDNEVDYENEESKLNDTDKFVTDSNENSQNQLLLSPIQGNTCEGSTKFIRRRRTATRIIPQQQTAITKLIEYIIKKNENLTPALSQSPVDAFLSGIAPTLKNFTPYCLHLAKSEIFAVVQKYEMKMLVDQQLHEENVT